MKACWQRLPISYYYLVAAMVFDLPAALEPPTVRAEIEKRGGEGGCERASERVEWAVTRFMTRVLHTSRHLLHFPTRATVLSL
jgi:hypothetical protein